MKKRSVMWIKVSGFHSHDSFVFILLVASSSGSAGYTNDLGNGRLTHLFF